MADKVLLVGINKYPGAELNGCINDIQDMANLLVGRLGFNHEDIFMLVDGRATTNAILDKLDWLANCSPGDRILFHYSGHGAQTPSYDGSGLNGLADCICPVDFDWSPGHMIIDKQFSSIFGCIPNGVRFNWVSDSCHSGDLTKGIPKPNTKPRSYPVPPDIQWNIQAAKSKKTIAVSRGMVGGKLDVGFISGCRSDQTSADAYFNGRYNGALTYFLLQSFGSTLSSPLIQVVADVNQRLSGNGYDQNPQVQGARQTKPFLA